MPSRYSSRKVWLAVEPMPSGPIRSGRSCFFSTSAVGRSGSVQSACAPSSWQRGGAQQLSTFWRSEEHTSELQSLMRISYAVFCLKKKNKTNQQQKTNCKLQAKKLPPQADKNRPHMNYHNSQDTRI